MNQTVLQIVSIISSTWKITKVLLGLLSSILIIFVGTMLVLYLWFARDIPDPTEIQSYKPSVRSVVYDNKGKLIGEFWEECRIYTPLDKIPKQVMKAFIDSEDARFYQHRGVDMRSILRAMLINLKAGEITQGGSTITQQITRAILLSREKTYARKIKEAILATRIERYLTKDQILELYLNQIFLGNRSYGVAAAARNYFHKDLNQLTLAETAILAGLPTAPSSYSPLINPDEARKKQIMVLERMENAGDIEKEDVQKALNESFVIYHADVDKTFHWKPGRFFTEEVRRKVKDRFGDELLYKKGAVIYTTLDQEAQVLANKALQYGLEMLDKRRGYRGPVKNIPQNEIQNYINESEQKIQDELRGGKAVAWPPGSKLPELNIIFEPNEYYEAIVTNYDYKSITARIGKTQVAIPKSGFSWISYNFKTGDVIFTAIDEKNQWRVVQTPKVEAAEIVAEVKTGDVLALVGGYSFDRSEFNRATQALRQPGSAFKPFVYAAALDKGYTFGTMILDEPVVYQTGIDQYWSPKNYGGKYKEQLVSFNRALIHSMNVPTIKIVYDIGTHYLDAYARKMGFTTHIDKYLSMALGSNAVYLNELVTAYNVFPNYGRYVPLKYITKITDAWGNELYKDESTKLTEATVEPPKPKTEEQQTDINPVIQGINEKDLNMELFSQEMKIIEQDKLVLTPVEMKILYGKSIPKDHVITPKTSYLMINMMQDVCRFGTAAQVSSIGKPVAGKTGTTNDETDAWFVGFTPDYIAGVWIGFDELKKLGKGETGGHTSAPIFINFMQNYLANKPSSEFKIPDGINPSNIASITGGSTPSGMKPGIDEQQELMTEDKAGDMLEKDIETASEYSELARSEEGGQPIQQELQDQPQNTPEEHEDRTPPPEQKERARQDDRLRNEPSQTSPADSQEW